MWVHASSLCYNFTMSRKKKKIRIKLREPAKLLRALLVLCLVIALIIGVPKLFSRGRDGKIALSDYPMLKSALETAGVRTSRSVKGGFTAENLSSEKCMLGGCVYVAFEIPSSRGEPLYLSRDVKITDAGGLQTVYPNCLMLTRTGEYDVTVTYLDYSAVMHLTVVPVTPDGLYARTLLINRYSAVGETYVAGTLTVRDDIEYAYGTEDGVSRLEKETAEALHSMLEAALAEGYTLYALSGYRDYYEQKELYYEAGGSSQISVAPPGSSEHQSGLAIDISWGESYYFLSEDMEDSAEYRWLTEHCYEYGFILRYPKGFEKITGYEFEPWHFRYIGPDAASEYRDLGCRTLEEYCAEPRNQ